MLNDSDLAARQLTRSTRGYLGGVCAGLGRRFSVDPTWFRLGWLAAVFLFGTGILLYLLLWWIIPREDSLPIEPTLWVRDRRGAHPPLQRTSVDRKFLGVCGGIARRWGADPALVRLLAVAALIATIPVAIAAYFIAAVLIPGSPDVHRPTAHPVEI